MIFLNRLFIVFIDEVKTKNSVENKINENLTI